MTVKPGPFGTCGMQRSMHVYVALLSQWFLNMHSAYYAAFTMVIHQPFV